MKYCPKCRAQNPDNAEYCSNCHSRLESVNNQAQPQQYPPQYQQPRQQYPQAQQPYQQPQYRPVPQQQPYNQQQQYYQQPQQNYYSSPSPINIYNVNQLPPEYRPLSPWAYFGYDLLFCIPIVGFILLIVFSFSNSNINRRNFARSYFCIFVIVGIAILIMALMGVSLFGVYQISS